MLEHEISETILVSCERYGEYTSSHEALGVLEEELLELKEAIRENDLEAIRAEAIDIAAVATRLARICRGNESFRIRSGG
jgi:NTP pyrophosphatase (non-canonical NTP hydrolase)